MNKLFSAILCTLFLAVSSAAAPAPAAAAPDTRSVPIVMYHSVCRTNNNDYVLHPNKLESDLLFLKKHGYKSVWLSELADFAAGKGKLPDKPIVLSFDDGFYNNYSVVLPLMKKHGFRFTVCVVGRFIEKEDGAPDRSSIYSYLNYADIRRMHESGLVEFANHTYDWHHPKGKRVGMRKMRGETDEQYRKALVADSERCRTLLQEKCGIRLQAFAYPFGYYNSMTPKILQQCGYRAILTCEQGINRITRGNESGLLRLKRYNRPNKYDSEYFFRKIMKI